MWDRFLLVSFFHFILFFFGPQCMHEYANCFGQSKYAFFQEEKAGALMDPLPSTVTVAFETVADILWLTSYFQEWPQWEMLQAI